VLLSGVQGITDLITTPGLINLDFADVKTVMSHAGSALMGIGRARGDDRATVAAEQAIASPLLEASMDGAQGVLLNISGGSDLGLFEINAAAELVADAAHPEANIIFGAVIDDALGDEVRVTVIAAGFDTVQDRRTRGLAPSQRRPGAPPPAAGSAPAAGAGGAGGPAPAGSGAPASNTTILPPLPTIPSTPARSVAPAPAPTPAPPPAAPPPVQSAPATPSYLQSSPSPISSSNVGHYHPDPLPEPASTRDPLRDPLGPGESTVIPTVESRVAPPVREPVEPSGVDQGGYGQQHRPEPPRATGPRPTYPPRRPIRPIADDDELDVPDFLK